MKKALEDILFFGEETNTWRPILFLQLHVIGGYYYYEAFINASHMVPRASHQCWWEHFVMKNNPCLMQAGHSLLLDWKGWLQRRLLAQAVLLRAWQDKTGRWAPGKYTDGWSSMLLAFSVPLFSFPLVCVCTQAPFLSLPPPPSPSIPAPPPLPLPLLLPLPLPPVFMHYFWLAPRELLNLFSPTFTFLMFFFEVSNLAIQGEKMQLIWG